MKKLTILFACIIGFAFVADKPAYVIYNKDGKETKYSKMLDQLKSADIVFFGEQHDNPICHWLQLELTRDFYLDKKSNFILGAEMFEADNQLILDEYINGIHSADKFEADARLWTNYKTDYKPVVDFARNEKIPFIATNIPRRYAALINDKGFEGLDKLTAEAKSYISPDLVKLYDPNVACYREIMNMGGMGNSKTHVSDKLPKAQASKDATMAHFILKNFVPGKLFFHFDGSYHSDNFESIVWWIKKLRPELKIMTITSISQDTIETLKPEYKNKADFIIAIPENMTRTNRK